MRALVVDDSRVMRALLVRILTELGFEVNVARDGREGLERLKALGTVDLAVVDWRMPGMTGIEFVMAVRGDRAYDAVPVVMVSSETDPSQLARALAAGANEYVMKPFTKDVIRGKLEMLGLELA